jgi:NAD(P)-dependent dehydrogenase (short-subunit alcohol dehydrogenase family)
MKRLEGRVCVVTGGAGSVGLATARLFLAEGARVALIDLRQAELDHAVERLGNRSVMTVVADVSRDEEVAAAIEAVNARFGPIDVLFSNAGNFGTVAPIAAYPEAVFDSVYAVHVKGVTAAA